MKFIILISSLFIILSCSSSKSSRLLNFFFDGVPDEESVRAIDSTISSQDYINTDDYDTIRLSSDSGYIVHYPYQEKECYSCHDEKSKSELLMPQPGLCYTCHEDYSLKYKFVHGPVSAGFCTNCHNAHMSKEKGLLINTGQQLCLFCHASDQLLVSDTHSDIGDTDCTLCHNPHGGEDRYILN